MRFAVGYQYRNNGRDAFYDIVQDYRDEISEVYFALPGHPSGRSPVGVPGSEGFGRDGEAVMEELSAISGLGIPLALLFNAGCYGEKADSAEFADSVRRDIDRCGKRFAIAAVTTTSPFVAETVKAYAGGIETRASVNMRIGSVAGMEYLAGCFDGYYLKRELNRDLGAIDRMKDWCDAHGKKLLLLANSGCLRDCSAQTYHDNLVAHESGGGPGREKRLAPCWNFLSDPASAHRILSGSWIRPEDLGRYGQWFAEAKLATRAHPNPRLVLAAYTRGRFRGNLMDILEPNYGSLFPGRILDSTLVPPDWFDRALACDKQCHRCGCCAEVWGTACVNVEGPMVGRHPPVRGMLSRTRGDAHAPPGRNDRIGREHA